MIRVFAGGNMMAILGGLGQLEGFLMLTSIRLEKYRGFGQYRVGGLARVNLLVGKNNCGKTSVLEAVHLLTSGGAPWVLAGIARQRGEMVFVGEEREPYRRNMHPVVSHFFHGHQLVPDAYFTLRADDGLGEVTVRVVDAPTVLKQRSLFDDDEADLGSGLAIRLEGAERPAGNRFPPLPVTEEGVVAENVLRRYRRVPRAERDEGTSVQFITPDSLQPNSMSEMWDRVLQEGRETEVIGPMRILEPDLVGIHFLSGASSYQYGSRAGILAALKGARRRVPLGSYGDGMRRLLALSLSLIGTRGGVLLVDEIDTGLHYSVMGDMWRLTVEAARQANVQVFATTHSLDCVQGLAWLCENHPELKDDVSLQKIDCSLEEAVVLDAERTVLAVNQGMEVR